MKSTFLSRDKNEVKLTLEFTAEEFEQGQVKAYQGTKDKFSVDGFRKGKAPRKMIENNYGADVFFEDAINELFGTGYPEAVETLDLYPVDRPSADFGEIKKGEGFTVTITVTVRPEFEVKDYKGVKVARIEHTVKDEDVDKELEALQKRNARLVLLERPAELGDVVLIDYAGFVGEEQFEGGTAERQPLELGSGSFIPGFEEQLVGVSVGDNKDVKVTFPEEYHSENLAGKEAIFKCTVHEIKGKELPELNDEFAKDVSEFDTLEELKKETKEKLDKAAVTRGEYETKNKVLEAVYEANDIDIPEIMVQDQITEMMQEFDQQLRGQGMDLEKYFEYLQKDVNEFRNELKDDAYKKTKTRLLVEAVANTEKFEVSPEDIENELQAMADQYKMEISKLKELMGADNFAILEKDIKMRKAVDFMFESAVIA
ncbi:MAG: trigger factor [Anaerovorax sp.]